MMRDESIASRVLGDGRFLLSLVGLSLLFSGCFAIFVALTRYFLPHDIVYIGYDAYQIEPTNPGLVDFMFHNRAAWGGSLLALGTVWLWLVAYPLGQGIRASWWILLTFGIVGFSTFLAFLGYGYLDTWHATATVALLPLFLAGMLRARRCLKPTQTALTQRGSTSAGTWVLRFYASGLLLSGAIVLGVGMTVVYVPQDLAFIESCGADLDLFSDRLLPVIAHDRASFGGGLLTLGMTLLLVLAKFPLTRSLWETIALSGFFGFGAAIGIHFHIGYTDFIHLAPAYAGAAIWLAGLAMTYRESHDRQSSGLPKPQSQTVSTPVRPA